MREEHHEASAARRTSTRALRWFAAVAAGVAGLGLTPGPAHALDPGQLVVAVSGPSVASNGEVVTYNFTVTNTGPAVSEFVFFSIGYTFPVLRGTGFTGAQGWQCNVSGGGESALAANCGQQGMGAAEVASFTLTAVVAQGCGSELVATVNGSVGASSPLGSMETRIPAAECETTTTAAPTTTVAPTTTAAPDTTVAPATTVAPTTSIAVLAPVPTAPTTTTAPQQAGRGALPATGTNDTLIGLLAAALLAGGAGLVLIARRRAAQP